MQQSPISTSQPKGRLRVDPSGYGLVRCLGTPFATRARELELPASPRVRVALVVTLTALAAGRCPTFPDLQTGYRGTRGTESAQPWTAVCGAGDAAPAHLGFGGDRWPPDDLLASSGRSVSSSCRSHQSEALIASQLRLLATLPNADLMFRVWSPLALRNRVTGP